jgi:hypothetical protein
MTIRRRKNQSAVKPVVLPEPPEIQKAKNLPMFGPGLKISIPLLHLPAYMKLYYLEPIGYRESQGLDYGVLLVKRMPQDKRSNHDRQQTCRTGTA